jgi:hypothetical protein
VGFGVTGEGPEHAGDTPDTIRGPASADPHRVSIRRRRGLTIKQNP